MPARSPIGLVAANSNGGNFFKCCKSGDGITRLCDGNRSTDERTDAGCDLRETFVEQRDLRPIDDSTDSPVGMNGLNGGLQLVTSHTLESRSRTQMILRFVNHRPCPERSVLPVERHKLAVTRVARAPSGFAMQHERKQTVSFGFAR